MPWFLEQPLSPGEARRLLGAFTAVMAALCDDREDAGRPLPAQGLEGLVRAAAEVVGGEPNRRRVDLAFLRTVEALAS